MSKLSCLLSAVGGMEDIVFLDSKGVPRARICLAGGSSFDSTCCGVTPPFLTSLKYIGMVGRGYDQAG